jgi:transposase
MTTSSRRTLNAQFKFQVALEAVKGLRSINEIAADYKVHPTQVSTWKKELLEGGSALFERKNARNRELEDQERHTAELERTLGRVVIEKEFLVKKCKQLGIEP